MWNSKYEWYEFRVVLCVTIFSKKRYSVPLSFQLVVGRRMSYLRYLWFFGYRAYCVVFFFAFCSLCCQFLCFVHFWLSLRYSLTFIEQIYHVWEGYFRKIPVERRTISRAERRGKFSLKTGIFRKYPSQTWYICLITPNII